jgi:glycosyltransferase involved in cell wall biosynthesis
MKLSVIIPCFNAASTITAQLEALATQQWSEPWEIIISDNGSTDDSMEIVKRYKKRIPNLRIVDASARRGQPYALNVGAQASVSESMAFCDADDEVATGWVAAIGGALSKYDFVACRMDIDKLNPSWVLKSRQSPQQNDVQKYLYPPYLMHAGGGTLGFKKWVWEAVGGFDETFPLLHDTDFCWKAQKKGIKLIFVPEAVIHIKFRDTLSGIFTQAKNYAEYNVKIYKKYIAMDMPLINRKMALFSNITFFWQFLRSIHSIRNKESLAYWAWQFGWRLGRLKGSIKYRVFSL